jgi:hypothetical protein
MREVKFRYYSKYSDGSIATDEKTLIEIEGGYFRKPFLSGIFARVEFTGLKDKKGKEIYEGDIVNVPYNHIGNKVVIFNSGKFNIVNYDISSLEVVGNKFKNPETSS